MYHKSKRMVFALLIGFFASLAPVKWAQAEPDQAALLVYCGITMVRPMTEIARNVENELGIKVIISQGGSEDLYQSLKKSGKGDLYLPGESEFRTRHLAEGLLGDYVIVGYNKAALFVRKGNPKGVKPDIRELMRKDLTVILGNPASGSIGNETRSILEAAGLYDAALDKAVALLPDSRTLNLAMRRGEGDLTINWRATAFFPDNAKEIDVVDLDDKLAKREPLQLTLLNFSKQQAHARHFMRYAASEAGRGIFRKHGFITE
jgi:molybdate transport system substrate-binding protein